MALKALGPKSAAGVRPYKLGKMLVEDKLDMIEPTAGRAVLLAVVALAELVVGIGQFNHGQAGGAGVPNGGRNDRAGPPVPRRTGRRLLRLSRRAVFADVMTRPRIRTYARPLGLCKQYLGAFAFWRWAWRTLS